MNICTCFCLSKGNNNKKNVKYIKDNLIDDNNNKVNNKNKTKENTGQVDKIKQEVQVPVNTGMQIKFVNFLGKFKKEKVYPYKYLESLEAISFTSDLEKEWFGYTIYGEEFDMLNAAKTKIHYNGYDFIPQSLGIEQGGFSIMFQLYNEVQDQTYAVKAMRLNTVPHSRLKENKFVKELETGRKIKEHQDANVKGSNYCVSIEKSLKFHNEINLKFYTFSMMKKYKSNLFTFFEKIRDLETQDFVKSETYVENKNNLKIDLLSQLTGGLNYIHNTLNAAHCDMKLENIFLDYADETQACYEDGTQEIISQKYDIKIGDFGKLEMSSSSKNIFNDASSYITDLHNKKCESADKFSNMSAFSAFKYIENYLTAVKSNPDLNKTEEQKNCTEMSQVLYDNYKALYKNQSTENLFKRDMFSLGLVIAVMDLGYPLISQDDFVNMEYNDNESLESYNLWLWYNSLTAQETLIGSWHENGKTNISGIELIQVNLLDTVDECIPDAAELLTISKSRQLLTSTQCKVADDIMQDKNSDRYREYIVKEARSFRSNILKKTDNPLLDD
ncbi:MAG: hypothetical protein GY730_06675 [bacterium]|nr:hypothetical protein [bacterium]